MRRQMTLRQHRVPGGVSTMYRGVNRMRHVLHLLKEIKQVKLL